MSCQLSELLDLESVVSLFELESECFVFRLRAFCVRCIVELSTVNLGFALLLLGIKIKGRDPG